MIGGALTAGYLCRQLGGSVGAWADAAVVPLLLAIGVGKVAMLLGGAGQGLAGDGRGGAAFAGHGPWAARTRPTAAYPTQLLEGVWALLGIPVLLLLERRPARRAAPGEGSCSSPASPGGWPGGRRSRSGGGTSRCSALGVGGLVALVLLVLTVVLIAAGPIGRGARPDQGPYPSTPVAPDRTVGGPVPARTA